MTILLPLDADNPDSSTPPDTFVTIPEILISFETLKYIGFSEAYAADRWEAWTNWPDWGPQREIDAPPEDDRITFLEFVLEPIKGIQDAVDDTDAAWYTCMDNCGMSPDAQAAIMDDKFTELRLSQSCLFWIIDTVDRRYGGLKDIQRTSMTREMTIRREAGRPRLPVTAGEPSSERERGRSFSEQQQQETPGVQANIWTTAQAQAAPGHTILYKVISKSRVEGLFDEAGNVQDLSTLLSSSPSDFSPSSSCYYFFVDHLVARYYASYAKRRSTTEAILIISLTVPNRAIETLREPDLLRVFFPESEWRELVWFSRRRARLPAHLNKFSRATLIIGTIAKGPDRLFHQMKTSEGVTEKNVLKIGRRREGERPHAVQYVFSFEAGGDWLRENMGRATIHVARFTSDDIRSFFTEYES
ncbi:hypothetical protein QBC39DRAFT_357449 [Podospora conica]|nr:hypothetical protein QBC39DRAFT_357449 [Schizothecium conicum]